MILEECNLIINQKKRELIEHGTPLFPVACYHENMEEERVPWHWHNDLEGIIAEAGSLIVAVEGERYHIKQGDGCFINGGVLHSVKEAGEGDCRLRSVVFHPRLVGGSLDSIFWQGYLQPVLSDAASRCVLLHREVSWNREALNAMDMAWQACETEEAGYEFEARASLSRLIFLLSKHRTVAKPPLSEKSQREAKRMKVMLQYVQEHYSEELTTAKIAQSAMVSESECLRCFRSIIGTTPIQYVRQIRLQRAAQLLESTQEKIADVGARCGFQEMSYFAKSFREWKGCTPREYRSLTIQEK